MNGREVPVGSDLTDHGIPCLTGRDPFQPRICGSSFVVVRTGRPVTMTAIGAVEMVLWDIKRKALNTPVYNRLGGESSSGVPARAPETGRNHFQLVITVRERDSFLNNHGI